MAEQMQIKDLNACWNKSEIVQNNDLYVFCTANLIYWLQIAFVVQLPCEFAEFLNIPSTTLRNYETDKREPGHTFLKQMSELFNVSVDLFTMFNRRKEVLHPFRLKVSEQET